MNPAQAYAAAVDALQAARRRNREIRKACECYEAPEESSGDYPGSDGYPPCPWSKRPREDWCDACAPLDIPKLGPLKDAQRAALRAVLAAGRAGSEVDTVTRTSVALVKARDDVKRLTKERAACVCDFEPREVMVGRFLQDVDPLRVREPFDEEGRITVHKRRLSAKTAPCWQHVVVCDEDGETGAIGDWCPDGWCESCERRQVLHLELRAARRRVVALTSGHLAATRAHMRRTGELPPAAPRQPKPEPRPLPTFEARPYPQPEPKEWPEDVPF